MPTAIAPMTHVPRELKSNSVDKVREYAIGLLGQNKRLRADKAELVKASEPTFGTALWDTGVTLGGTAAAGIARGATGGASKGMEPLAFGVCVTAAWFMDSPTLLQFAGGLLAMWVGEKAERTTVSALARLRETASEIREKAQGAQEKQAVNA